MFLEKPPKNQQTQQTQETEILETGVTSPVREWSDEEVAVLIGNTMRLKDTSFIKESPEDYKNKAIETYKKIKDYFLDNGAEYFENISDMYDHYIQKNESLVVRKEDPIKLLKLLDGEKIEMTFDPEVVDNRGDKYANSALWPNGPVNATSGIGNAFAEGRGMAGPIAMVAGIKNNSSGIKIEDPEDKMDFVGDLYRGNVKILSGNIHKEDLEFVVLRIMAKFVSEDILTKSEIEKLKDGKLEQIVRGFKF